MTNDFQREVTQTKSILKKWRGTNQPLRLHIHGEAGSGRREFLSFIAEKLLDDTLILLSHDFSVFPLYTDRQLRQQVHHLIHIHPHIFESFNARFPGWQESMLRYQLAPEAKKIPDSLTNEQWEVQFLYEFIHFASQRQPVVIIFKEIPDHRGGYITHLLRLLNKITDQPILLLTCEEKALPEAENNVTREQIKIQPKSVRETEGIVGRLLKTDAISSRLITNHMFIKSSGNLKKIRFMLTAYYEQLLDTDQRRAVVDNLRLQKARASGRLEDVFKKMLGNMSDNMHNAFAFMGQLQDPLPLAVWAKLLRLHHLGKRQHQRWLQLGLLEEVGHLGDIYVKITFRPWKKYLENNCAIYRLQPTLAYFSRNLSRLHFPQPVELSSLFFDAGEFMVAIRLAATEADAFTTMGSYKRALNRYAFLKRNITHFTRSEIHLLDVLDKMGHLQLHQRLYENAFESFRELRDRLRREQRNEWVDASLQMAKALFQMDLHSEAHYIIKDLKLKNNVPPYVHAFSYVLNGELEQNFGRPEYALKSYEKAAAYLPNMNNDDQVMDLFVILRERFHNAPPGLSYPSLIVEVRQALSQDSDFHGVVGIEAVRQWLHQSAFEKARLLSLRLLRSFYHLLTPRLNAQLRLYLSEIYAYYGKWYLSRSHLKTLLQTPMLSATPNIRAQVLLNLGVVEKELGAYGNALETLHHALEICREQRLYRQANLIKVHLGHVYLLVHAFVRAYDNLRQALQWAEEHHEDDVAFSAQLFLSSYSMQQEQDDTAERYLEKAALFLGKDSNRIDQLNYSYYQAVFYLKTDRLDKARAIIQEWDQHIGGMFKFENLSHYLNGRIHVAGGAYDKARERFNIALKAYQHHRMAYQELQIYRELHHIAQQTRDSHAEKEYAVQARDAFQRLLSSINDKILQKQIEESREYESLLLKTGSD